MPRKLPAYFDYLIEGFRNGNPNRCVHLGYWPDPAAVPSGRDLAEFPKAQRRLDELLLGMAALGDGQSVLDVGCGFGGTLEAVNGRHRAMRLAGVNLDPRQLEICGSLQAGNGNLFEWHQGDACELPLRDATFDRVLCVEAMFHFPSRQVFFAEAARVLKPGGLMVCSDIVLGPSARKLDVPGFCIEAPLQDGYGPWPDFWGDNANHAALAASAGLVAEEYRDIAANTRPSHVFTAPEDASLQRDTGNLALRASLMLRWLHANGHLNYLCFRFAKPAAAR